VTFTSPSITCTSTLLAPSYSTENLVPTSSISVSPASTTTTRPSRCAIASSMRPRVMCTTTRSAPRVTSSALAGSVAIFAPSSSTVECSALV